MSHASLHVEANGSNPPRAPRRKTLIDHSTRTVRVEGAGICNYDDMPEESQVHCGLVGLRTILNAAEHPGDRFDDLCDGKIRAGTGTRSGAPKPPALRSKLRRAIALALVERSRNDQSPFTEETAQRAAAAMTPKQRLAARHDPLVAQHMQRLRGKTVSVMELIG